MTDARPTAARPIPVVSSPRVVAPAQGTTSSSVQKLALVVEEWQRAGLAVSPVPIIAVDPATTDPPARQRFAVQVHTDEAAAAAPLLDRRLAREQVELRARVFHVGPFGSGLHEGRSVTLPHAAHRSGTVNPRVGTL